ncbi:hypothetical protein ES703_38944 [subsurface metagenome]
MSKQEEPRIMCCMLCGRQAPHTDPAGLMADGWFLGWVSRQRGTARRPICGDCLERRIYGRKLQADDFYWPE